MQHWLEFRTLADVRGAKLKAAADAGRRSEPVLSAKQNFQQQDQWPGSELSCIVSNQSCSTSSTELLWLLRKWICPELANLHQNIGPAYVLIPPSDPYIKIQFWTLQFPVLFPASGAASCILFLHYSNYAGLGGIKPGVS